MERADYQRMVIGITHIPTDLMPADIFTKALPYEAFVRHRATLMNLAQKK